MMDVRDGHPLFLDQHERSALWKRTVESIEAYAENVDTLPVEAIPEGEALQSLLARFDFDAPMNPLTALDIVLQGMQSMQTHTANRRYFGLFNPAPTAMGIAGEALAAAFNTQLAAWSHSPFAVQAEQHLVRSIGQRFGDAFTSGTFTSGGAEANLTAMIAALVHHFPAFSEGGLRALPAQPTLYASAAAHHSLIKGARVTGLGTNALRIVPCDESFGMDLGALVRMIRTDRAAGYYPFLVVATVGATATGIIEPIAELTGIASAEELWLHVDAAWGGFAVFIPELRTTLDGIGNADSITFDPHKMLSVPMGAGLFLTRHQHALRRAFAVTANYMPASEDNGRVDPFTNSIQWSRRFIGLKVLLSLAVAGWDGYADVLRRQVELGNVLRRELQNSGWRVLNQTPFPVVCFVPEKPAVDVPAVAEGVQRSGKAWISAATLPDGTPVLRACITNYRSDEADITALVEVLAALRRRSCE